MVASENLEYSAVDTLIGEFNWNLLREIGNFEHMNK